MTKKIEQPKLVFSLNTFPITNNRWNMGNRLQDTIFMTALSVLYCCKWYPDVAVYVDEVAYEFLKELPCKVIKTVFENDPLLWMKSKINVIQNEQTPFIHVDNDVFFKKKVDLSFESIIVERKDAAKYNYDVLVDFFDNYSNELNYWSSNTKMIPSCGVIGFANVKLRDDFLMAFKTFENVFKNYKNEYNSYMKKFWEHGNRPELCLVMEQYNLGSMIQAQKIPYTLLLKGDSEIEQSENANILGYTHLHGTSKYETKTKKRIHFLFETTFPEFYKTITKKMNDSRYVVS